MSQLSGQGEFVDALSNVRNLKNQDAHDTILKKSKMAVKGSLFGLAIGLMYGWYYKKNLYVSGVIGAIGGGGINYLLFKKD
jgi:membrane associated rhomboid family serine protease